MRRGRSRFLLVPVSAVALLATSACTGGPDDEEEEIGGPVSPVSVALSPEGVPDGLSIGVVVSLSSAPDEGAQWNEAAEGAGVAAYRYALGDVDVSILARDDRGTASGANQAVRELVDEGVSGIVLATEGDHLTRALDTASELGVPTLLPYEDATSDLPAGVWATGPDAEQVGAALAKSLEGAGASQPVLVDAGNGPVSGLSTVAEFSVSAGGDTAGLAARVSRATRTDGADSVVVSGPAELQAQVVQALQAANVTVPVLLSDDAVSPVFADTLAESGGSLTSPLTTAGLDVDDVAALDPGTHGAAVSAYLAALRATAEDGDVTDFFDDEQFEAVALAADVRSHDAVIALVNGAAAARSTDPTEVATALASRKLYSSAGLAGPALDFGSPATVPDSAVVPLHATTQDPGLRPVSVEPRARLYWFKSPPD